MFCCHTLENSVMEAGKRGIAVLARNQDGRRAFYLQSRACDSDEEDMMKNIPRDCKIPRLCTAVQVGIPFCPFCGARLENTIAENEDQFDILAKAHEEFLVR